MRHIDAELHVRGESLYVDDLTAPENMLHAAIFGAPIAHGKLNALALDAASEVEGVVRIVTSADIPGENQIGPIIPDEPLLAATHVHYIGQPIAVVVATSKAIARKAAALIEATIDPLPIIVDPREAFEKGEIIGVPRTIARGDVDDGFANAEIIVEGRCDIGGQEHLYLETQRSRATPMESGRLRVHSSTQSPYAAQRMIAQILGIPHNHVEVEVTRLGGAFGGKEDQATQWACIAALASVTVNRTVELVLNRAEDMRMTGKRHPYKSDFKIGATRDGQILAYQVKHYQNSGAGADLSTAVLERTLMHATGSYDIPNVSLFGASCRTNLPPNTAFRGFGGPQGMFVIESAIAKLAEALDLPTEEIQRKNLLTADSHYPYGQPTGNDLAIRTWDHAISSYNLDDIRASVERYNSEHIETKRGYAVMPVSFGISFTTTYLNQASALMHVYTDGSVALTTGGVEMGQGLSTNMIAIAAKTLGIDPANVHLESTNTTRIANMSPSAASATTLLNGNAVVLAAKQILSRLYTVAADQIDGAEDTKISIIDGSVHVSGRKTDLTWAALVRSAYLARVGLSAHAFYATPDLNYDKQTETGSPFAYHVNGTAIVEVTLDCMRGTYDVDAVKIVHDLGRPIVEQIDIGQIEGGLAQGLGWMSLEDLQYDDKGRLLSHALATYKLPDADFMPDDIQVKFLEKSESALGPYGSKAVGEPPLMYGIGLYFALRKAIRAFRNDTGADDQTITSPLTPERVLMALYAERGGSPAWGDPAQLPAAIS